MNEVIKVEKKKNSFAVTTEKEIIKMSLEEVQAFLEGKVKRHEITRSFYQKIGKNYCEVFLKNKKNALEVHGKKETMDLLKDTFSLSVSKMRKRMERELRKAAHQGKQLHIALLPAGIGTSCSYKLVREQDFVQLTWHYPYRDDHVHEEVSCFFENIDPIMGPFKVASIFEQEEYLAIDDFDKKWREKTQIKQYEQGYYKMQGQALLKQKML